MIAGRYLSGRKRRRKRLGKLKWSTLFSIAMKGLTDTVKILLQHGARLDMVNRDGWNALHLAVREGAENPEWKCVCQ